MTGYKPGEVILIPFPFTDLSTFKQRPALIISSQNFNRRQGDIIIAAITSHIPQKPSSYDYLLLKTDQHMAGLPKSSLVKLGKIVTIDQRLIRKRLGCISEKTAEEIFERIKSIIGDN